MVDSFLDNAGGFTPVSHLLAQEVGLVCAAVYGAVWRYCKMKDGTCKASLDTLGTDINLDRATVMRSIKKLCELGFLIDQTPGRRNAPHTYILSKSVAECNSKSVVMRNSPDESVAEKNKSVAHNNSSIEGQAETVAESHLKKEDVLHDKALPTFEILYNRWLDNNLGELKPRQVEMFGDYYDEHPDWVSEIIDKTIGGKPANPWQYFVKIINSWVKNGRPAEAPESPRQNSPPALTVVRNGKAPPIDEGRLEQLKQEQEAALQRGK